MRILIITGIFPPDIGGPATYVPAIGTELVKRGHEITVVTLSDSVDHDDRLYPFRVVRLTRRQFKPIRFLLTTLTLLRWGNHSEVLLVNGLYLEAIIANIFLRRPLVQKVVGDWAWERATNKGWVSDNFEDFQRIKHSPRVETLKGLRNFCVHRADTVIVPSRYLANWVAKWGLPTERIRVVYNAVESPSFSPLTIPLTTKTKLVTVGRLVRWKQVDHLIEAIAECDGAGLVIVGDGPERNRLEALVRVQHLSDRVYFAGQRDKVETLSLMAACDVFVLNSTYEGFPHVVLEAMSVGLPIVATAAGGTPEVVRDGENGLLIAPNANGALSKNLVSLLSSLEQRQCLANGAKHTATQFRHSAMVEKTETVLLNCVDGTVSDE
jgi:glycosyltransferase involved in cell wall biosynthesis